MPAVDRAEYNPFILGFTEKKGPVFIPLQEARRVYGKLPSDFKLVSAKDTRKNKKGLNLALGKLITELLEDRRTNLKADVYRFFKGWHRNYQSEFGLELDPFCNLNNPGQVVRVIIGNQEELERAGTLDLRNFLSQGFIRKDVLNSIPEREIVQTAQKMLTRKIQSMGPGAGGWSCREALGLVRANDILRNLRFSIGFDLADLRHERVRIFADEIAAALLEIHQHLPIRGFEELKGAGAGQEMDFEFAVRDRTYLQLGKKTGDCTADKTPFQADRHVENIYWTVFPWILDRNYQILKVYFQGIFIMKAHLLPLFIFHNGEGQMVLAVDAIETVRAFRDDMTGHCQDELLEHRDRIFFRVIDEILRMAADMGIERVYAEKFSNTPWVRQAFEAFPEIFLHVNQIVKLDELEDIYCFAQELSRRMGRKEPGELFMELQMKNMALVPRLTKKMEGVKSFAVLKGDPDEGIPMKRVFGI